MRWLRFAESLLAAVLVLASQAHAQIATLSPDQPRWGQPITLTYDPAAVARERLLLGLQFPAARNAESRKAETQEAERPWFGYAGRLIRRLWRLRFGGRLMIIR